jgi:protein-disulfide isomerase
MKAIGDVVLKHVVYFNVYAEYCGDQKRSSQELKKLMVENPAIKQFFDACKLNPDCRKLDLFAFLLLPMQRLTKYPLLLKVRALFFLFL